ncbi:MAG: ABC transporter permease, partial [Acidobacteria bacterium]|nr:ABC transporter permease [Acidobacteriota bacterium]
DELSARLLRLPGVEAVAMAASVPPEPGYFLAFGRMQLDAASGPQMASEVFVSSNLVAPGYFDTLGIPLLEGRAFTRRDAASADKVAVVEVGSARHLWPDGSPIGRRFRPPYFDSWFTVVGVVGETRQVNTDWPGGDLRYYVPFPPEQVHTEVRLVVRTDTPAALLVAVRREAWDIDPRVALLTSTMDRHVRDAQARPRFAARLMTVFALVGLLLAAGGIFAVVSCDVSRRTREVGVRMALGARRPDVLVLVSRRGAALTAGGAAIGLGGAVAVTRLAESVLFEIAPLDPVSFIGATAVLAGVALAATWVLARRAAGVDPVEALRAD